MGKIQNSLHNNTTFWEIDGMDWMFLGEKKKYLNVACVYVFYFLYCIIENQNENYPSCCLFVHSYLTLFHRIWSSTLKITKYCNNWFFLFPVFYHQSLSTLAPTQSWSSRVYLKRKQKFSKTFPLSPPPKSLAWQHSLLWLACPACDSCQSGWAGTMLPRIPFPV